MKVRAFYYAPGVTDVYADIFVRVHTKLNQQLGDLKGTNFSYAEQEAFVPTLLFWRTQQEPARNAVVIVSATEGYRVDHTRPEDGLTRHAEVKFLTPDELLLYAAPE